MDSFYTGFLDTFGAICVAISPAAIHSYFDNVVRKFKPTDARKSDVDRPYSKMADARSGLGSGA